MDLALGQRSSGGVGPPALIAKEGRQKSAGRGSQLRVHNRHLTRLSAEGQLSGAAFGAFGQKLAVAAWNWLPLSGHSRSAPEPRGGWLAAWVYTYEQSPKLNRCIYSVQRTVVVEPAIGTLVAKLALP